MCDMKDEQDSSMNNEDTPLKREQRAKELQEEIYHLLPILLTKHYGTKIRFVTNGLSPVEIKIPDPCPEPSELTNSVFLELVQATDKASRQEGKEPILYAQLPVAQVTANELTGQFECQLTCNNIWLAEEMVATLGSVTNSLEKK